MPGVQVSGGNLLSQSAPADEHDDFPTDVDGVPVDVEVVGPIRRR